MEIALQLEAANLGIQALDLLGLKVLLGAMGLMPQEPFQMAWSRIRL